MSKKYLLFSIFVALILLISACTPKAEETAAPPAEEQPAATEAPAAEQPAATSEAAQEPIVFRLGYRQSLSIINPVFSSLAIEGSLHRMIYESLFRLNLDGQYVNDLVTEWSTSEDGLTVDITITDQSRWSDGEPLTADDVAFTYNLYKSRPDGSKYGRASVIDSVIVKDDTHLQLLLTAPQANLPDKLTELYILPRHIWEPIGTGDELRDFTNEQPVGSGPFILTEWRKGEFAVFETNKNHWRVPPAYDQMIWVEFTNSDAEVQALLSGQIDAVTGIPLTAYPAVSTAENIAVIAGMPSEPHIADIIINQIDPANCPPETQATCGGHPALRDVAVRKALAYATNKQELIDILLMGLGVPGITVVPAVNEFFNSDIVDYPFDIAMGNQILDEAGYLDINGDGIRDMPDGSRDLTFKLNFTSDCSDCPREAELLISNWEQLGIKIQAEAMEEDAMVPYVNPNFQHDIVLWGWYGSPDPDFMLSICTTDMIIGLNQEAGYSNPEYDALYLEQASELDHDRRVEIVWRMQQILFDDVVYIIPFYDQDIYAVRTDRFTGWPLDKELVNSTDVDTLAGLIPIK